jgi:hypothetical protein
MLPTDVDEIGGTHRCNVLTLTMHNSIWIWTRISRESRPYLVFLLCARTDTRYKISLAPQYGSILGLALIGSYSQLALSMM